MKISHLNGQTCSFEKNESLPMEDETFTNFSRRNSFKRKKRKRGKIFTMHKCVERPRHRTSAVATILLTSSQVPELRSSLRGSKFWKLCIRSTSSRIIGSRENSLQKKSSSSIRRKETPLRIQHIQIYFNSYFFFFFFCKFYSPELQLFVRRFAPWRIQKCLLTHSLLFINPFTIRMFHGLCKNELRNILRLLLVRIYFCLIFDNWEKKRKLRILWNIIIKWKGH